MIKAGHEAAGLQWKKSGSMASMQRLQSKIQSRYIKKGQCQKQGVSQRTSCRISIPQRPCLFASITEISAFGGHVVGIA